MIPPLKRSQLIIFNNFNYHMESLQPRLEPNGEVELKGMVESLKSALHYHKQHIALEVKESLSSELTQLVSNSCKNLYDYSSTNISNLEYKVRFQFQAIDNRLEIIENKSCDIYEKLKTLEELFNQKNNKNEDEFKRITEKCIFFDQSIKSANEIFKKLEESFLKLNNEIISVKENFLSTKSNIINEVIQNLNEYRREIESFKYENNSKLQAEVYNLHERLIELKYSIEQKVFSKEKPTEYQFKAENKYKEEPLFVYIQEGFLKSTIELSSLRLRVEKLEISQQACEDYRKSRINR